MQVLHIAHDLHSVSKNAAVSGATAPKPPTKICALIARFILTQMPARGEAAFRSRAPLGEATFTSHRFLNLSRKSLEACERVIFLMRAPRPFSESNLRTGFGYCVWNTRSQIPLVIP